MLASINNYILKLLGELNPTKIDHKNHNSIKMEVLVLVLVIM